MKYCSHCGRELFDEAVFCPGCGCATPKYPPVQQTNYNPYPSNNYNAYQSNNYNLQQVDVTQLVCTLSQRLNTNAIIWLVIGILQILAGVFVNFVIIIVGVLNIISAVNDMKYSKALLQNPRGIVPKFEPLAGPIITLVYNLIVGGVVGAVGSIYYFLAIRSFVMENKPAFQSLDSGTNMY